MLNKIKKISYRLIFIFQYFRIFFYRMLCTNSIFGKPCLNQPLLSLGEGDIIINPDVKIGYFPSPYFLNTYAHIEARSKNASIEIGEGTFINNNCSMIADEASIVIGKNCFIGSSVEIINNDFHPISKKGRIERRKSKACDVIIGNHVFIGSNVKIIKGTTIGEGAVIGMGSIVCGNFPENVIIAGNPAKIIRTIKDDE